MSDDKKSSDDKELDDLLDSALKDFDSGKGTSQKTDDAEHSDPPTEQLWNDEFFSSQAKLFEQQMSTLFGGGSALFGGTDPSAFFGGAQADPTALFGGPPPLDPSATQVDPEQMLMEFKKIAEKAAMAIKGESQPNEVAADPNFSQSITDALKGLSIGRDNLQAPFSPDDLAGMFGNIGFSETGENNAFLPFMQNMMQSLLSAEVLLPSMKDLVEKYPDWLEKNKASISSADNERYTKQLQLMEEVCNELESEKADDPAEMKKERFQKVLELMQKMQDLGQPPPDLVGEVGATAGLPTIDPTAFNDPSQCPAS